MRTAIRRTGERDFWKLAKTRYLRRETKNHVPAILAAAVLSKEPAKHVLSFEPLPVVRYDTVGVERGADLRVIARCGVGYDSIDLDAATRCDVLVTNTPGANKEGVAEHAVALMLAVAHGFPRRTVLNLKRHAAARLLFL